MMRRALAASGGYVPSAIDVSPAASSTTGVGVDDGEKVSIPFAAAAGASDDSSPPADAVSLEGAKVRACGMGESDAAASTVKVSGRKRREAPQDSKRATPNRAAGATSKRPAVGMDAGGAGADGGDKGGGGGGSGKGSAAARRMEARLGDRNAISLSGRHGGGMPSPWRSPESTRAEVPDSAPKRMRLVDPNGEVVSQVRSNGGGQGGERASTLVGYM